MKKLVATVFIMTSLIATAQNVAPKLNKEVQGVNKEQLETREIKKIDVNLEDQKIDIKDMDDNITNQNDKIELVNSQNDLEKEVSQDIEEKSSLWKYILGGLVIIGTAIAL